MEHTQGVFISAACNDRSRNDGRKFIDHATTEGSSMTRQANPLTQHREYVQYLSILRRWWWLLVLGAVLATGTSGVLTARTKPTYQATSTLLVNTASIGAGSGSSYTDPQYALMLATATTDMIVSHRVADLIIRAAHL